MNKELIIPKLAEGIQDEIYCNMSDEKKMSLFFTCNSKVLAIAKKRLKSKYPNLNKFHFSEKLHEHVSEQEKFYDSLFNKFANEEIKK